MRTAQQVISRRERLVVAVVRSHNLSVRSHQPDTWVSLSDVFSTDPHLHCFYANKEGVINGARLENDLEALVESGVIRFITQTGGQTSGGAHLRSDDSMTWRVGITDYGVEAAVEYEKPLWRREFDKQPASYIIAVFAALSFVISVLALIVSIFK